MALPVNRPADEYVLSTRMADVATAELAWLAVPSKGRVVRAYSVAHGTTNGENTISFAIDGATALTDTLTIANGAAAGEVDSVIFGQGPAYTGVTEGSKISLTSDGDGSTTVIVNYFVVIERT